MLLPTWRDQCGSLAFIYLIAQSTGAPHQPRDAKVNPADNPLARFSVKLLPKTLHRDPFAGLPTNLPPVTFIREPPEPLPTKWPVKAPKNGDVAPSDLSKLVEELESLFKNHKTSSSIHPTITKPPKYATSTKSIAGLSANSATSTKIDGVPIVLPIWVAAPGVGVIVVPAVPVPGAVVPPPPGRPTLSIGEDGKPTERGNDHKSKPKTKDAKEPTSKVNQESRSPTHSKPPTRTSKAYLPSETASKCPLIPNMKDVPVKFGAVHQAKPGDEVFVLGLPSSPKSTPTPTKPAVKSVPPEPETLPPKPISPTETPQLGRPVPKGLFPLFGPDNWSVCNKQPPCNRPTLGKDCQKAFGKFDLATVYAGKITYTSVDPVEQPSQDGCAATFACEDIEQYPLGVTGADLRNAGSAIQAAGCENCGWHRLSRPSCTLSLTYCGKGACQDAVLIPHAGPKLRRQASGSGSDDCPVDDPDDEANDPIALHEEPIEEFTTRGTEVFRMKGYQDIAALNGIYLLKISTGAAGSSPNFDFLENVNRRLTSNPQLKRTRYAADHIFELALFTKFFLEVPKYKPILDTVLGRCGYIQNTFINTLNSHANLVCIDAEINNYKMLYLQKDGPSTAGGAARYAASPGLYGGLLQYMQLVRVNYFAVADRVAFRLQQVSADAFPGLSKTVEKDFEEYAKAKWDGAMERIARDDPGKKRAFTTTTGCGAKRQKLVLK